MANTDSQKSNVEIKSNLMLKKRAMGCAIDLYIPVKVLIAKYPELIDVRLLDKLSEQQREAKTKALFLAREIIDIE